MRRTRNGNGAIASVRNAHSIRAYCVPSALNIWAGNEGGQRSVPNSVAALLTSEQREACDSEGG